MGIRGEGGLETTQNKDGLGPNSSGVKAGITQIGNTNYNPEVNLTAPKSRMTLSLTDDLSIQEDGGSIPDDTLVHGIQLVRFEYFLRVVSMSS